MYNKFTQAEVEELVASVKANPENLSKVFRELSNKWGTHSPGVIKQYFYKKVKNTNECFFTIGEKKAFLNRKVIRDGETIPTIKVRKTMWSRLKNLLRIK